MGSLYLVLLKPGFQRFPCFPNRFEEPPIQTSISEDAVEALVMPILPGAPGVDEADADLTIFDPVLDLLRYEFGTVVALDRRRRSL